MAANPIDIVLVDGGLVDKSAVRGFEKLRGRQRVANANEIRNTSYSGQFGGLYKADTKTNFDIDTDDTTTADDGVNCIIDADGNRWKPVSSTPAPTTESLGGVFSLAPEGHKFLTGIDTDGTPVSAQPGADDLTDGVTGIGAVVRTNSPEITTPTGIVKADVGLGNVDNTSDTTKNAADVTLTNKTIDTADNTFKLDGAAFGTATEATAALDAMVGDSGSGGTKGLVPAPGSGDASAGKYLKADGTWGVPAGSGGGFDISTLPTDSSPDSTADYMATYDASDSSQKKVLPRDLRPDALSTASGSPPSYSARAWATFTGVTAASVLASGNIASITRTAAGTYAVVFTTAMLDTNYAIIPSVGRAGGSGGIITLVPEDSAPTVNGFTLKTLGTSFALQDAQRVTFAVFR